MTHRTDDNGVHWFEFDHAEARGKIGLQDGAYGPILFVGDKEVGFFDLMPAVEGGSPRLLLDNRDGDEAFAKVVFEGDGPVVVVNGHKAERLRDYKDAIYADGGDPVYREKSSEPTFRVTLVRETRRTEIVSERRVVAVAAASAEDAAARVAYEVYNGSYDDGEWDIDDRHLESEEPITGGSIAGVREAEESK